MLPLSVAVLASGRGNNLQALMDAAMAGAPYCIRCVIVNNPEAGAIDRTRAAGIPVFVIPHTQFPTRSAFELAMEEVLLAHGVSFICLAGFMRLLTPEFIQRWRNRLVNIHPSLLPAFPGLNTHARALAAGVRLHGCTVHFVRAEVDTGPIILQGVVPVCSGDTPSLLAERVLVIELKAYPQALTLLASGSLRPEEEWVEGGRETDALRLIWHD